MMRNISYVALAVISFAALPILVSVTGNHWIAFGVFMVLIVAIGLQLKD